MNKTFNKKYLIVGAIVAAGFFFLPVGVEAATRVYFELTSFTISEGDTFLADLEISTPDRSINVIDGTILYDRNKLEIKEISTGGSILSLWPKPPVFSNKNGSLNFVGGATDGFRGEKGKILRIIFLAKSEGKAQIDFLDGFSVFLHDGQGTQINPGLRPLTLNILEKPPEIPAKDEWRDLLEKDKTPPKFDEAIISRDPRVFDNQYFVSFFATDDGTGISHYEIKEGSGDFVRAESPHLLRDQTLAETVQIKAVDNAGNESVITPELASVPGIPYKTYLIWSIIALV
ncbi:MAG: cohesin domain-containing protein, partial [Candidatus Paceibacterota bacterium]